MIAIDYTDSRPIYEQIVEKYKLLILRGVLLSGDQMPSVRMLAMDISTNPNTVQKAFAELERQGFIYSVKGKGNFVAGGETLKEGRKQEIAEAIAKQMLEAISIGIPREEMLAAVEEMEKRMNKEAVND